MKTAFGWLLLLVAMMIVFMWASPVEAQTTNNSVATVATTAKTVNPSSEYTQCTAITKDGTQCERKTKNASGICTQHENLAKIVKDPGNAVATTSVQCSHICSDGHRCQSMTKDASGKCWQHQ